MKKGHFQRLAEAAAAFRSSATFLRKSLALKPNGKLRLHSPSDDGKSDMQFSKQKYVDLSARLIEGLKFFNLRPFQTLKMKSFRGHLPPWPFFKSLETMQYNDFFPVFMHCICMYTYFNVSFLDDMEKKSIKAKNLVINM